MCTKNHKFKVCCYLVQIAYAHTCYIYRYELHCDQPEGLLLPCMYITTLAIVILVCAEYCKLYIPVKIYEYCL